MLLAAISLLLTARQCRRLQVPHLPETEESPRKEEHVSMAGLSGTAIYTPRMKAVHTCRGHQ